MPVPVPLAPETVFRDNTLKGVPASGSHEPIKHEIRTLLRAIVDGSIESGSRPEVIPLNPTTGNSKNVVKVTTATARPAAALGALYLLTFAYINDGPMTIEVNGDVATPLLGVDGEPVSAQYTTPGMRALLVDGGDGFYILSGARGLSGPAGIDGQDGVDGLGYLGSRERPGDVKRLFTEQLSGGGSVTPPIADGIVATSVDGQVLRFESFGPDPQVIASRLDQAVEAGLVYVSRFGVRRIVNSSDPLGDAVEFGLALLDASKQIISERIVDSISLSTGDGRTVRQVTFSRDLPADEAVPTSTRYVRPFVRIAGTTGTTDIEVLATWETNGLPGPKGDVGDVTPVAQTARDEAVQAAADSVLGADAAAGSALEASGFATSAAASASDADASATSAAASADAAAAASTTSRDGLEGRVAGIEAFGAIGTDAAVDTAAFVGARDALVNGPGSGIIGIPSGNYFLDQSFVIDNTGITGETETGPNGITLRGEDARLSTVQVSGGVTSPAILMKYGTGAAAHSKHRISDFSLVGTGQNGLRIENAAYMAVDDITLRGFNIALDLQSVLTTTFRDLKFDTNTYGVSAVKGDGFSYPNALIFDGCVFGTNTLLAYSGGGSHHQVTFNGGTVENNGTQGDVTTGGVFINFDGGLEGAVGATFRNVYFEGNAGQADIRLENIGSEYVTVIVEGCNFNRLGTSRFVTQNIRATGRINLILIGNAHKGFAGYVESAERPYVVCDPLVRVTEMGNFYADPIATVGVRARANLGAYTGSVNAGGGGLSLPAYWSSASGGTGVVTITHNLGLTDLTKYTVSATSTSSNSHTVQRIGKSANSFQVVTTFMDGTLVNAPFDFTLHFN